MQKETTLNLTSAQSPIVFITVFCILIFCGFARSISRHIIPGTRVCARVNDLNRPHAAHNTHAINGVRRRPRQHRYTEVLADQITRKRQRQRGFDCTSSFGRTQMHTLSGCVCICWRIFQGKSIMRTCVCVYRGRFRDHSRCSTNRIATTHTPHTPQQPHDDERAYWLLVKVYQNDRMHACPRTLSDRRTRVYRWLATTCTYERARARVYVCTSSVASILIELC